MHIACYLLAVAISRNIQNIKLKEKKCFVSDIILVNQWGKNETGSIFYSNGNVVWHHLGVPSKYLPSEYLFNIPLCVQH